MLSKKANLEASTDGLRSNYSLDKKPATKRMIFGIKHKLLAAFSMTLGSTLLACGLAYFVFYKLQESVLLITQSSVPIMANSMELTRFGVELDSNIPALASAPDESEREAIYQKLEESSSSMDALVAQTSSNGLVLSPEYVDTILDHSSETKVQVAELNEAVKAKLKTDEVTNNLLKAAVSAHYLVDEKLINVIEMASADFVALADKTFSNNIQLVDNMLNVHLESMFNALKLKMQVAEVVATIVNSLNRNTSESLKADSTSIISSSAMMDLSRQRLIVRQIPKIKNLDKELEYLRSVASSKSGIYKKPYNPFDDKTRFEIMADIKASEKRIFKMLDPAVDSGQFKISLSGKQLNDSATKTLPKLIDNVVEQLVSLVQMRAELNTQAGLIAQVPQANTIESLTKLAERHSASKSVFNAIKKKVRANKQIRGMKKEFAALAAYSDENEGIFFYRKNAIDRQLLIEQNARSVSDVQSTYLAYLLEEVRTNRSSVDDAGERVFNLVKTSLLWLAIISAGSILFTVLVYWIVVSRGLLTRLMATISALRTLAAGSFDVSVDCSGRDELTDLAKTVEVFRKNGVEARQLVEEQEISANEKREREEKQRIAESEFHKAELEMHKKEQETLNLQNKTAVDLQQRVDCLLTAVSSAAQGNLEYPIDIKGDDPAGQMADALRNLFTLFKKSMIDINDTAGTLSQASERLSCLSVDMNDMAVANASNSQEASEIANDVGGSIESVAGATEQMSSSIKEIARNINEAESVANSAVLLAQTTDSTIHNLVESSNGIGSVIKVITNIAEQTNLLALNATIEAARAGDAGKGFAVVANEVKELAKETSTATDQIESKINDIQRDTSSAVEAIRSIGTTIDHISSIQTKVSLAIGEQTSVTMDISRSIGQTANSTDAFSSVIAGVADKAVLNQRASGDVNKAAVELSNMAEILQDLVGQYTTKKPESSATLTLES